MEICRNNKSQQEDDFIKQLLEMNKKDRFIIVSHADNVGWSGIHYLILFKKINFLEKLLKILDKELLDINSQEGWTPLFLAIY